MVPNLPPGKQIDSKLLLKSVCPSGCLFIRLLEEVPSSSSNDEFLYASPFNEDATPSLHPALESKNTDAPMERQSADTPTERQSADDPAQSPALDVPPTTPEQKLPLTVDLEEVIPQIISYCKTSDACKNPVEILRCMQNKLVRGRTLDVRNVSEVEEGETSLIMIDREQLFITAFDEVSSIPNKFLTLEVQFYGEVRILI